MQRQFAGPSACSITSWAASEQGFNRMSARLPLLSALESMIMLAFGLAHAAVINYHLGTCMPAKRLNVKACQTVVYMASPTACSSGRAMSCEQSYPFDTLWLR